MEGMHAFRFGNWEYDIFSRMMGREITHFVGSKSEQHCVYHYINTYLQNEDKLPDPSSIKPDLFPGDLPDEQVPPYLFLNFIILLFHFHFMYGQSFMFRYTGPGSDISGYNPLRNDYDVEFDNDLEMELRDLDILGDEDSYEQKLKTSILQAFNGKCLINSDE